MNLPLLLAVCLSARRQFQDRIEARGMDSLCSKACGLGKGTRTSTDDEVHHENLMTMSSSYS